MSATLLLLICLVCYCAAQLSRNVTCQSNQRLDTTTFTCVTCPSGATAVNGVCFCPLGSTLSSVGGVDSCTPCPSLQTSSIDRTFCSYCSPSATFNNVTRQCLCPQPKVLTDRSATGAPLNTSLCLDCPAYGYMSAGQTGCQYCPDTKMNATVDANGNLVCICASTAYTLCDLGTACLPSASSQQLMQQYPTFPQMTFYNLLGSDGTTYSTTVTSYTFQRYFIGAAQRCKDNRNATACQIAANLCVYSLYDEATAACQFYEALAQVRRSQNMNFPDWPDGLPWLYYGLLTNQDSSTVLATAVTLSTNITDAGKTVYQDLRFYLARYALTGAFQGFERLGSQLQLCSHGAVSYATGSSYQAACYVQILNLVNRLMNSSAVDQLFELYMDVGDGTLQPLPTRIMNMRVRNGIANQLPVDSNTASTIGRLVRRFFVTDFATARSSTTGRPTIVRVATSIRLVIRNDPTSSQRILLPVLEIAYTERELSSLTGAGTSTFEYPQVAYSVQYVMTLTGFWSAMPLASSILFTIIVLIWLKVVQNYTKRNPDALSRLDIWNLSLCVSYLTGIGGSALIGVLVGMSAYWTIFFKFQSSLYVMLPSSDDHRAYLQALIIAFVLHLFYLGRRIAGQCTMRIAFIDWEKPRLAATSQGASEEPHSVSVWRSILMINEYLKLSLYRRTNIPLQLSAMLLCLHTLRWRYFAAPRWDSTLGPSAVDSILLFGVNLSVWLCLVVAQYLARRYLYERFVHNAFLDYVDMLSVTNLSLVILDEPMHGYYVHGRSVHPQADTDIVTLNGNLKREETEAVIKRGLQGGDDQTFTVFLTKEMSAMLDKLQFGQAPDTATIKRQGSRRDHTQMHSGSPRREIGSIQQFWRSFFDKHYKDMQYTVQRTNPTDNNRTESVLVTESQPGFLQTMLLGLEGHLNLSYILLYNIVDMAVSSSMETAADDGSSFSAAQGSGTVLGCLVLLMLDAGLRLLYSRLIKRNIERVTAIDSKFLLES